MKKHLTLFLFMFLAIGAMPYTTHALFKSAEVTLVVVDEEGRPLEGVDAGVGFENNTGWGTDVTPKDKFTDGGGKATFTGQCNGHIAYGAEKKSYYPSYYDYDFKDLGPLGWEPWNPVLKIVMRKIKNPVPMYVRDTKFSKMLVPVVGKNVGFDLVRFDWIPPYGSGQYADIVIHVDRYFNDVNNFEEKLSVTFSNENDGIQVVKENFSNGSSFKLPRFAPEGKYLPKLVTIKGRQNGKYYENFSLRDNYIFRVRSEINNGEITYAMYGKIHGPLLVTGLMKKNPKIIINYYLNPDTTRNLEHDPSKNLFGTP